VSSVYIIPNSYINDIIVFLHGALLKYTLDGGKLLPQHDDLKSVKPESANQPFFFR